MPDDAVTALPSWVTGLLMAMMGLVIAAMFAVTVYNLSAPRSTLKNLLAIKGTGILRKRPDTAPVSRLGVISPRLLSTLALSAQVNLRTTRTTLAIAGFALLGVGVVAVFALSGPGVRDLRTQVMAGVVTLVASIAGYYFGQASTREGQSQAGGSAKPAQLSEPPTLAEDPDIRHLNFKVGVNTAYQPVVTGIPAPTLALLGTLPEGLSFERSTGRISGKPLQDPAGGVSQTFSVQIVATNGVEPDQSLTVELTVTK